MKLFITLLFLSRFSSLFSQVYTSSCTATPQMENLYRNDAYKYSVLRLVNINSSFKDSVDVPVIYRDSISKVLYAIHNMPGSPLKDTIMNLFGFTNYLNFFAHEVDSLHIAATYPLTYVNGVSIHNLSVKSIEIYVSTSVGWASEWASGNYNNTSEPRVNSLVNNYALSVITAAVTLPNTYHFTVRGAGALNPFGLANKFNAILNSTTASTPTRYIGDGNSISLNYQSDGIVITYSNRCGDCPAGCLYGRSWNFKVYFGTCSVEYLGSENFGFAPPPTYNVYTCTRGPVVPVTFGSVTGYLQSGKAALSWKILTQVNVKEYIVERSDDGRQFYTAATVAATNALAADYTWKDANHLTGTAWYRIKAVDRDGKFKYSAIVKISGATKGNSFTIYPNPVVSRTFTVQFGTPASEPMSVSLYSTEGKRVWAYTINLSPQTVSRTLTLPAAIAPGLYALVVENNEGSYRQTLVISE